MDRVSVFAKASPDAAGLYLKSEDCPAKKANEVRLEAWTDFIVIYYVYLIKSETNIDQIYIGFTENLDQRMKDHNSGRSIHTSKYRPWKIETYLVFDTKQQALDFEKYLKSHSGRVFAQKRLL